MTLKRYLVIFLILAATVSLFLWFRGCQPDYVNLPPTAQGPWVAFGDSLTEGYGASQGHDYPTLLGQRLGISIQNFGKSGETSSDALQRVGQIADELKPRVVLLCFGGNDSLQGEGSFVVLIGIRSASLRDKNAAHFRALAKTKRVLHVPDILKGLAFKPVYMSDAIHPNDAGYARVAERVEKALSPVLAKLKPSEAASPAPQAGE
jgi:acyl-CoA thioesterase I